MAPDGQAELIEALKKDAAKNDLGKPFNARPTRIPGVYVMPASMAAQAKAAAFQEDETPEPGSTAHYEYVVAILAMEPRPR